MQHWRQVATAGEAPRVSIGTGREHNPPWGPGGEPLVGGSEGGKNSVN